MAKISNHTEILEDIRFSDGGVLAFFRSWNLGGAVAASQQTFLLSPAPIQANTRGGDQKHARNWMLGPKKYL